MKKYKNVRAKCAARCAAYEDVTPPACLGVPEPFMNPACHGYKCKCTEYVRKRGANK